MTTHTPIFRTWQKRLESGVLTKAQCQQFVRVVLPLYLSETDRDDLLLMLKQEAIRARTQT